MPPGVPRQAQRAVPQLRLNGLTSMASYQAFIGRIMSPICPHSGSGEDTAEHLLLSCPKWALECQCHFSDWIDIKDVFQYYVHLVVFLISSEHLPPHISVRHCLMGSPWRRQQQRQQLTLTVLYNIHLQLQKNYLFQLSCWLLYTKIYTIHLLHSVVQNF